MKVFLNNRFVDYEESFISTNDLTLNRGYGVFDFFRISKSIPLFIDDHLNRLLNSAKELRLNIPYTREEIKKIIIELIQINHLSEAGVRIILTGGISDNNFTISDPNFIITNSSLQLPTEEDFNKGINLITHPYLRTLPQVKSTNYLMAIYLQEIIFKQQADDVIFVNNDQVLELPRANIFIITHNDALITPHENILAGVTRKNILEIASSFMKVEERNVSIDELLNAKEVFISSTTKIILPVATINKQLLNGNFEISKTKQLYLKLLEKEVNYINNY
ncbi:MAG: aminotransferase class IV family protein [Chitinophagaceae bacterium]|nr:aminotransferase class IV family protein [Chitinophagaceae bacterium]